MTKPVLVRNPNGGDRRKSVKARDIARRRGYDVRNSTARGETLTLAESAARDGASVIAACGGDGSLNEVVRGVDAAGALDDVRLGVIPTGTGNDFADNLGIRGLTHAFDVVESGEERRLDLGMADDRPFVNSCVGGLTAEASARTTPERKRRLGVLAYVLSTLHEAREFDGLRLDIRAGPRDDPVWSGEAEMLLIGNARRFPGERERRANVEDGLLNVVIIERAPSLDYLSAGAAEVLLRRDSTYLTRLKVPRLHLEHDGEPVQFSLDGETIQRAEMDVRCRPNAMRFAVGERYVPNRSGR
ncbi:MULTISPECIES: YegS/Rv2252/BmrU family lipid kinase [unclassified Haladaptatus]|uniref:diacylglycerol/lipid kinase family protein n=1 Tax=unclassified Haladaptatus TaxID=2622732 RepID=UPI00209BD8CC|nr:MULTISPECIES: YegS/Rv2252/BmrU family lipid kinase [unclassified Haladaptatus]MCO8246121.1 YegS/Rv2252/BmrU family lipid kinase [Haladaptatus sp. AB643]MCO8254259.1 YegS/Rv2252/BmrU family lipid kinase [Haladaptatus sp. AB618]